MSRFTTKLTVRASRTGCGPMSATRRQLGTNGSDPRVDRFRPERAALITRVDVGYRRPPAWCTLPRPRRIANRPWCRWPREMPSSETRRMADNVRRRGTDPQSPRSHLGRNKVVAGAGARRRTGCLDRLRPHTDGWDPARSTGCAKPRAGVRRRAGSDKLSHISEFARSSINPFRSGAPARYHNAKIRMLAGRV